MNNNRELEQSIVSAFKQSKYRWRTAYGIAKEINFSVEEVYKFINRSNLIIKAKKTNKRGQPLFALREKYKRESSFGVKILNALTNKIH